MKVSVVIVNFNGKKYICKCVDSVLRSIKVQSSLTGVRVNSTKGASRKGLDLSDLGEVVVVENGSTDGSWELLEKKYKQNKIVKIIKSKENLFFAGGSNLGARKAKGEWLVFLNSDTVVDKDWLKELVKTAKKDKKLLLQPKILNMKMKGRIDNAGGKYVWPGVGIGIGRREKDNGQFDGEVEVDFANGTCLMIGKKFFFELSGFDEWYRFFYEDVDLNLRAKKKGGKAVVAGKSVIRHLGGVSFKQNVASDEVVFYLRRNRLVTVLKNFTGIKRWVRWGSLVIISLFCRKLKMSIKAVLMSVDWLMAKKFNQQRLRELKRVMGRGSFSLLDLGCGDGKLVELAKEQGIEAKGIDEKQGQKIENFQVRNLENVVSMYHVLEHLNEPEKQLKRIRKWLKKDGMLVIEVPLVGNLTERWLGKDYLAYWDKTHVNFWNKSQFLKVIDEAGLQVVKKGQVWQQVFFHAVTAKLGRGWRQVLVGVLLWPWLKLLSILGFNDEMIRVYCRA